MIEAVVVLPALAGLAAFGLRSRRQREVLLVGTAILHAGLVGVLALEVPPLPPGAWIGLDALGLLFLIIVSVLFSAISVYAVGYLRREPERPRTDLEEGFLFDNEAEPTFVACLLFFLATMSLVTVSRHLGLLWVGVEATTLASAPLIYFHRHHRSLEATWKYLLVCSVGIGFALLGNLLLAASGSDAEASSIVLDDLLRVAPRLERTWLEAGFLLLLVGYGTKMGLAPMHAWLPDAHSESPSLVSALLSGALLNCAFLGILRAHQVLSAAGSAPFASGPLQALGLVSMALGALFIIRQPDYKRLLAYSSVEHMGVLALGVGVGGAAAFGAMLHALAHSLGKAALFLVAGNFVHRYASKQVQGVRGALAVVPCSAALWMAGLLAIAGVPPFALFLSEFTILRAALEVNPWVAALYLGLLAIGFVGVIGAGMPMVLGRGPESLAVSAEPRTAVVPPFLLAVPLLLLGLHLPAPLVRLLEGAARLVGAG